MSVDRREANLQKLAEANDVQDKTQEAIWRIQRQAAETESLGAATLEELRKQSQQIDDITAQVETVSTKLDQSQQLQNRFDLWAGNWLGGKKAVAIQEANAEIAARVAAEGSSVKEVFENEKYHMLSGKFKPAGMVQCANPSIDANLFAPSEQTAESKWTVDYSLGGIDPEGWTYGKDFDFLNRKGTGKNAPDMSCFVRRRKWRYHDKDAGAGEKLAEVKERNAARVSKQPAASSAEKIGYVPRARAGGVNLAQSGLTSSSMSGGKKGGASQEPLDSESAAGLSRLKQRDEEIDKGVDVIGRTLDNIGNIAKTMNEETKTQNSKLNTLSAAMDKASNKQAVVNARMKSQVDHN